MANDFTKDRNCVALWTFEDTPGFLIDSINNVTADVTNNVVSTATAKEGVKAVDLKSAGNTHFDINDTSLVTGFPFRYADGASVKEDITVCYWIYHLSTASDTSKWALSKYDGAGNKRTFLVEHGNDNSTVFAKGYNNGISQEFDYLTGAKMDKNKWYHVGIGYREFDKSYYIRVWDDNASDYLAADTSGVFAQDTSVKDVQFKISHDWGLLNAYIDELVVFNRKLTLKEINKVRKATYNRSNFGNLTSTLITGLSMEGGG